MWSGMLEMDWPSALLAVAFTLVIAYLVAQLAARLGRHAVAATLGESEQTAFASPIVRRPIRLIFVTVFILTAAALLFPALDVAGVRVPIGLDPEVVVAWSMRSGLRITLVVILAYAIFRIMSIAVRRFEHDASQGTGIDVLERAKRARTLGRVIHHAVAALVLFISVLMILRELHLDIMPVLTSVGIVGLAIGFGAQTLVRDIIGGFFLILENQVRVGDVASINGTGGFVEAINLRTIVLRDLSGTVHVFPNGGIERLANLTKDFSFAVLDVGVAYKEDTDRVVDVLRRVADELMEDPQFRPHVIEPLDVLGVDAFGDSQVTIKVRMKTVPLKQWEIARQLRRRIKKAFDAEGIEIPFPHRSIYFGEASKPWLFRDADAAAEAASRGVPYGRSHD